MKSRNVGSGGDDANFAAWEAQIDDSDSETGTAISGALDTSAVAFNATLTGGHTALATADTTNAMNAPTYARATACARISVASGSALTIGAAGFTVEKIAILSSAAAVLVVINAAVTIRRFFARQTGNSNGVMVSTTGITATIGNACIVLTGNGVAFGTTGSARTMNIYHSSILVASGSYSAAYRNGGTVNAYACIVQGKSTNLWVLDGGGTYGGNFNVSQDAGEPGAAKYSSTSGWFANPASGSEDLSLATSGASPGAASARGKWIADGKTAIDETGFPGDCATDLVGTTRAAPIDPGCWQTPASGGGTVVPVFDGGMLVGGLLEMSGGL